MGAVMKKFPDTAATSRTPVMSQEGSCVSPGGIYDQIGGSATQLDRFSESLTPIVAKWQRETNDYFKNVQNSSAP